MKKEQLERLFKVLKNNGKVSFGYYQIGAALPKELVLQAAELFCGKRNKIEFYGFVKALFIQRLNDKKLFDEQLFDKLVVYLAKGSSFRCNAVEQVLSSLQSNKRFDKKEIQFYSLVCEVANTKLSDGRELSRHIKASKLKGDYRNIRGDFMDGSFVYIQNGIETEYYKRLCKALGFQKTEYEFKLHYIPNKEENNKNRFRNAA